MSTEGVYDFRKDVRRYIMVFVTLAFLTVITVAVSYWEMGKTLGVAAALFIATIKAGLVACYFMHLISERKFIYSIVFSAIGLFLCLVLLTVAGYFNTFLGIQFLN
jgi:cytochrome c oxidase subunit 4